MSKFFSVNINFRLSFIISLTAGLPGLVIFLFLRQLAENGQSGTEFAGLIFWPLFLVTIVTIPLAIIFGFIYMLKTKNIASKIIVGFTVVLLALTMTSVLTQG